MNVQIQKQLEKFREKHKVKILYACETGSRAWGVPSKNSDYDLRIIYCRDADWYLSVEEKPEEINLKDEQLDAIGWDLKKTLRLLSKSNPVLFEWLNSPNIYSACPHFVQSFEALTKNYFDPRKSIYHYLGIANAVENKFKDKEVVPLKKYFIKIRSILSAMWVKEKGTTPPIDFMDLLEVAHHEAACVLAIHNILNIKKTAKNSKPVKRISTLEQFCKKYRKECAVFAESLKPVSLEDTKNIEDYFRHILKESSKH